MPFKVIEVDPKRRRLVLSERKAIRQYRQEQKVKIIDTLKVGDVRKGVVTSLREFGAFVDIGGADGLIHISELAWRHVDNPGEILSIGQDVETMVIGLDKRAARIGLSLKRLEENPWTTGAEGIAPGQVLTGIVSCTSSAGTFVQVDGGIEGLLRLTSDSRIPARGEQIQVRVVSLDLDRERLDLEWMEQAEEDHQGEQEDPVENGVSNEEEGR